MDLKSQVTDQCKKARRVAEITIEQTWKKWLVAEFLFDLTWSSTYPHSSTLLVPKIAAEMALSAQPGEEEI